MGQGGEPRAPTPPRALAQKASPPQKGVSPTRSGATVGTEPKTTGDSSSKKGHPPPGRAIKRLRARAKAAFKKGKADVAEALHARANWIKTNQTSGGSGKAVSKTSPSAPAPRIAFKEPPAAEVRLYDPKQPAADAGAADWKWKDWRKKPEWGKGQGKKGGKKRWQGRGRTGGRGRG